MSTDEDRSTQRKAEAALLLLEARSRRRLRAGLALIVGHHVRLVGGPDDVYRAASAAGRDLDVFVSREVKVARAEAATSGVRTAEQEIQAVRAELSKMSGAAYRGTVVSSVENVTRAEAVGQRFGQTYIEKVSKAARDLGERAKDALTKAGGALRSRVDTIAASESSEAFSAARKAYVDYLATRDQTLRADYVQRWSAALDRRTCDLCASLDGAVAEIGGDFRGYTPGSVHPRCRCIAFLVQRAGFGRIAA